MSIRNQPCPRRDGGMEVDGDMEVGSIKIKTLSIKINTQPVFFCCWFGVLPHLQTPCTYDYVRTTFIWTVFAGRMMFEAGLRRLTKRGPLSLQILCVYESALEYLKTSRRSIKRGGWGRVQPPHLQTQLQEDRRFITSSARALIWRLGFTIEYTTYLRHATLFGNSGTPYIFNTPPHSAITVHHIS